MLHVCIVAFVVITCTRDNIITTMSSVAVVGYVQFQAQPLALVRLPLAPSLGSLSSRMIAASCAISGNGAPRLPL